MAHGRHSNVFGKRTEPHTIIIAHGNDIRHFTVRPWIAAVVGCFAIALALGYLVATTYLVLRDDLIGASIARQARMQHAYEDRISALRAQVDRITSRQLLDQQLVEDKVSELMARQTALTDRQGVLGPILDRANRFGLGAAKENVPVPSSRPGEAEAGGKRASLDTVTTASLAFAGKAGEALSPADRADHLFVNINKALRGIEEGQLEKIRSLAETARDKAQSVSEALAHAGYRLKLDVSPQTDLGGPLLPPETTASAQTRYETEVAELDRALDTLEAVRHTVRKFPIANPAPGKSVTSSFGNRTDPFLGRQAFHSGIDFRTETGHPVRATGAGVVIKAGRNGGYGNMVEIDHGRGLTTRFAHLSRIDVSEGQKVEPGMIIGAAGSTGRSTGPHLHYEVRKNGDAINPARFLEAGRLIAKVW